jgi:hypothetical protein
VGSFFAGRRGGAGALILMRTSASAPLFVLVKARCR